MNKTGNANGAEWTQSIYSDGTSGFVSKPVPQLGDDVTIAVRCFADAPVKGVYLRQMINGAESWKELSKTKTEHGLSYYAGTVHVNEPRLAYHFAFACEDVIYFYNQVGVTTWLCDDSHDFVLLSGFAQPEWVRGEVFYQIFPERFCNGRDELTPRDGEVEYMGHTTIQRASWDDTPLSVEDAHGMEFFGGRSVRGDREDPLSEGARRDRRVSESDLCVLFDAQIRLQRLFSCGRACRRRRSPIRMRSGRRSEVRSGNRARTSLTCPRMGRCCLRVR